jgi:hypothetical protein
MRPGPAKEPMALAVLPFRNAGFRDGATLELYLRARQAHHEASPEGMQVRPPALRAGAGQ